MGGLFKGIDEEPRLSSSERERLVLLAHGTPAVMEHHVGCVEYLTTAGWVTDGHQWIAVCGTCRDKRGAVELQMMRDGVEFLTSRGWDVTCGGSSRYPDGSLAWTAILELRDNHRLKKSTFVKSWRRALRRELLR